MSGRRVALETPIGDGVRAALTALGHEIIDERNIAFGGAQLVVKLPRGWAAASGGVLPGGNTAEDGSGDGSKSDHSSGVGA